MDKDCLERTRIMVPNLTKENVRRSKNNTSRVPAFVSYSLHNQNIVRKALAGRLTAKSRMPIATERMPTQETTDSDDLAYLWNILELDGKRPRIYRRIERPRINVVDFFCGCGGLSLGIKHAAEAIGARPVFLLAVDVSESALSVYVKNLRPLRSARQNVEILIDYASLFENGLAQPDLNSVSINDTMAAISGTVDLFVAGPPCEGNSNFNNRTRRFDCRNNLYVDTTVAGIALDAKVIVIENVPMVTRSYQDVVKRSVQLLKDAGYSIQGDQFTLRASDFGTPQNRRRHFLIASKSNRQITISDFNRLKVRPPTALEAIISLSKIDRQTTFDQPSRLSKENLKRVKYLIDHDEYDLPNNERPDCHRLKNHSYRSIYGRIQPDEPAATITTGFLSPGRGRFTPDYSSRKHKMSKRVRHVESDQRVTGYPQKTAGTRPG